MLCTFSFLDSSPQIYMEVEVSLQRRETREERLEIASHW